MKLYASNTFPDEEMPVFSPNILQSDDQSSRASSLAGSFWSLVIILVSPFYEHNQQQPDGNTSYNLQRHTNNEPHSEQVSLVDQSIIALKSAGRSLPGNRYARFWPNIDSYCQQGVPNRIRATGRSGDPGKRALFSLLGKLLLWIVEFLSANERDRAYIVFIIYCH